MNLRDCLVRSGVVDSPRLCALPLAVQLFFRNLLHVCDGAGRFLADADDLRTTLYRHALDRVSRRHLTSWLASCHAAGLVRLYTGPEGRGYGEIPNYGQRDSKRRVLHPAREDSALNFEAPPTGDPPEVGRALRSPPGEVGPPPLNGIEEEKNVCGAEAPLPPPRSAAHTPTPKKSPEENLTAALARLAEKYPQLDLPSEIARAEAYVRQARGASAKLTLFFFENKWLPKAGGPHLAATAPIATIPPEPLGWRDFLNEEYPQSSYSRGGPDEGLGWAELPRHVRELILPRLPAWERTKHLTPA